MNNRIRIAQISDIHFYESSDGEVDNYRHSVNCLKKIQLALKSKKPDYLVVTGDISNIGDKISLERAYQWLNDKIYVDGDYYGLECKKRNIPIIAVPGNHDAFDAPKHGANLKRWQSSLKRFNSVFHDHVFSNRLGVDWKWLSSGKTRIFICRVDSCYLGDRETEHLPGCLSLSRVAKGKISCEQSKEILRLYDEGIRGELKDDEGEVISAGEFMSSLKILVMHHYLFEPPDEKAETLLHFDDKKAVFQNIAMSDFDILLCGHKHISDIHKYAYADHFDARGKIRLAFNHVRRSLGISSLPMGTEGIDGKHQSRLVRFLLGFLVLSKTKGGSLTSEHAAEIIDILQRSLNNPGILREELKSYLRQKDEIKQAGLFDDEEIRELQMEIKKKFSHEQKKGLVESACTLKGLVERLGGRPFVQLIAGSSAKKSETGARARALNIFEIEYDGERNGMVFKYERRLWSETADAKDGTKGDFTEPLKGDYFFAHDRISSLLEIDIAQQGHQDNT